MAGPVKTVALVDWHWDGHHPTYFKFFASALAELGCRVIPYVPAPDEAASLLATSPAARSPEVVGRIGAAEAFHGGIHLPVRPRSLQRFLRRASSFRRLARRLDAWERRHGSRVDMVFFTTMYDHDFADATLTASLLRRDWAGLYLHASCIHTPGAVMSDGGRVPDAGRMFRGSRFRGLGVLDESAIPRLEPLVGGRRLVRFPDITDDTLPGPDDRDGGLARKIERFAGGRPVVALTGHLRPSKGLVAFTRAAQDPRLREHAFVVAGAAQLSGLPAEVRRDVTKSWEAEPRVFAHLARLDEPTLNAVMRGSDVLFAAYSDFPHSSNTLTKAAILRKPVIVSEGHLMAERVRRYGLGMTVPQDDVEAVVKAILRLTPPSPPAEVPPRWDDYAALHSYGRLREAFGEILG
jgi:glycosyltransferase involved in cell wall biosynthesis